MNGSILAALGAIILVVVGISPAFAASVADFAIFGDRAVFIEDGLGTSGMPVGNIGSNGSMTLDDNTETTNLSGGGMLQLQGGGTIVGNVVFNGDVTFGAKVNIIGNVDAGGKVTFGGNNATSTIDGSVTSGGDFEAVNGLDVTGNVDVGINGIFGIGTQHIAGDLTLGGTFTGSPDVDGTITQNGSPVAPIPYMPVAVPGASPFGAGGADIIKGANETTSLMPGVYGLLQLGPGGTLELTAPGDYFFNAWVIGAKFALKLDLDLGVYKIFIVGNVSIGDKLEIFDLSSGTQLDPLIDSALAENLLLEMKKGNFQAGGSNDWFGTLFAPDGDIRFGDGARVAGAMYAGNENADADGGTIDLKRKIQMKFVPFEPFGVPTLRVAKTLIPDTDIGQFVMNANGMFSAAGGDGIFITVPVPVGQQASFSEAAAPGTNINVYTRTWSCSNGLASPPGDDMADAGDSFTMTNDSVVCTFTNTRKTPENRVLTVVKALEPSNDPGLFVMFANGVPGQEGGNGATKTAEVTIGAPASFSEQAGTDTSLNDYFTTWQCSNGQSGVGPVGDTFPMPADNVTCTFTNTNNAVVPIPTLGEWGLILLGGLLSLFMVMPGLRRCY